MFNPDLKKLLKNPLKGLKKPVFSRQFFFGKNQKGPPPLRVVKQAAKTDAIESIIKGGEGGRLLSYVAGHKKCPKNSSR